MGLYNSHFPGVIGQEWVPIRDEKLVFSPAVSSVELGYEFNNSGAASLGQGRFYVDSLPLYSNTGLGSGSLFTSPFFVSIYETGTEADTGPIESVTVPCTAGTLAGTIPPLIANASNVQDALYLPNDGKYIWFLDTPTVSGTAPSLTLSFATDSVFQLLANKRIFGINVLYSATSTLVSTENLVVSVRGSTGLSYGTCTLGSPGLAHIGDTNWWYSETTAGLSFPTPFPFTPKSVRRFEATHATPLNVRFSVSPYIFPSNFQVHYAALQIFYCAEKRVGIGGITYRTVGMNSAQLYTPAEVSGVSLSASKQYTVALSAPDGGDSNANPSASITLTNEPFPTLNALRQLYPNEFHNGVRINHPTPTDDTVIGKTFTREDTDVIPQLTLHTSGTPDVLGDVHPYGRQATARIYGNITATAGIEDFGVLAGGVTTQQVRYYARRFGDTQNPLNLARASSPSTVIASITPVAFDAIEPADGILDGWKEVTLDLIVPQSFTGTRPSFQWSSANETYGNHWEVLGVLAPALSGVPSNTYNQAPAKYQLPVATYGFPISGASDLLQWLQLPPSQPGSAVSSDNTADGVLMFAVSPPTVTGISISELTQSVTGFGAGCGENSLCCVPTGIKYNHITWGMGSVDGFSNRVTVSGWGTGDSGDAWTLQQGIASQFMVSGGVGITYITVPNVSHYITQPKAYVDSESSITFTTDVPVSGTSTFVSVSLLSRFIDTSNFYRGRITLNSTGLINFAIAKEIAGVATDLVAYNSYMPYGGSGVRLRLSFAVVDSTLTLRLQRLDADGNVAQDGVITTNDTSLPGAGLTGVRVSVDTSAPSPLHIYYDDYCVGPGRMAGGGTYELQRMDPETDWQTIMRGGTCAWYFNDYEARVGQLSTYRMRIVDAMNFAGPWSSSFSNTLTSPGVTGQSECMDGVGVLIFTSNAAQSGAYNLAHMMAWEQGGVSEDFVFPEAQTVQLARVYQRNFPVASKGTERGGEQFSRVLLVNAVAISPEKLANMTELRDMAWADLPYVCVRDELGNRWFALVTVPGGAVRTNRNMYLGQITVTEVSDTAFAVDPA